MEKSSSHVVIVPTPGMGHLIPLAQLAKRLVTSYGFTVSFVVPMDGPPSRAQEGALADLPGDGRTDFTFLPPADLSDVPADARIETRIALTLARSIPALRARLAELSACRRLGVLVVDLFGTDAFEVGAEFGLRPYIFYPTNALCLSLFLHLPDLHSRFSCEYSQVDEPVRFPGCIPLHGRDFLDPVQDRKNDAYRWVLHHTRRYRLAEGILVNTFEGLEEGPVKALADPQPGFPPVYPVGPLVQSGSGEGADPTGCVGWLDGQPRGSVLFVSFGSGGALSCDQLAELAHGLELSEQRFLWVVRPPNENAEATYFRVQQGEKRDALDDFLPEGFLGRTRGRGLVVPTWAPQARVLAHGSTGGFLTHCGWNSILEAVAHGVPLVAWPLYAEQRTNAVMLTEGLRVAIRPRPDGAGLIRRGEVAAAVRGLMEGEEGKRIRNRMRELEDAAARAISEDGSSTRALSEVARKWASH